MEEPYLPHCHNLSLNALSPTHSPTTPPPHAPHNSNLDHDVVVILAAMICFLVCALGLNSMLHCVVRCTQRAVTEPFGWVTSRRMNAGLKKEDVVALPVVTYARSSGSPASASGCAICLADFSDGDNIRVLPKCSHRFHVGCIDTWLLIHCSCPNCRHHISSLGSETSLEIVTAP